LGRLFDAVAALIGLKDRAAFEGQAAMMLEMVHPGGDFVPYDFDLDTSSNMYVVDPRPVIRAVVGDLMNHRTPEWISGRFHAFAVRALAEVILRLSDETGIRAAALSGGCFQNRRLTRGLVKELAGRGLNVYLPTLVPANDGGLALGQAAAAMARLNPNRAVGFVTR
jgi:hydrogenase maturation protein HypF